MSSGTIRLREGDTAVTWTITIKTDGVADNITGATVLMYARDDSAAEGTNIVDGVACTLTDAANGVCTFSFTTAHQVIAGTGRTVRGQWKVKVDGVSKDEGLFLIEKDAFTA
jgi:hypothetical protein